MDLPSVVWSLFATLSLLCLSNCDPLTKHENVIRINACGKSSTTKVFQGRPALQSEAPWSVFILYYKTSAGPITCTGTVISPRHILTATHCFARMTKNGWLETEGFEKSNCRNGHYILEDPNELKVMKFESNGRIIGKNPERITLVNACLEKNVQPSESIMYVYEDFAIIDLSDDVVSSPNVQMACVPKDTSGNTFFAQLEYYGFGVDPSNPIQDTGTLRHETINILPPLPEFRNDALFLARDPHGKTIACSGDSGGGSVQKINGKTTVVGVLMQTSCAFPDRRNGTSAAELYAAVGYYSQVICKLAGVCETSEYDKYHSGYVRKPKTRSTTPITVITMITEKSSKDPSKQENGDKEGMEGVSDSTGNSNQHKDILVLLVILIWFL